jgi:O-antigen ligase
VIQRWLDRFSLALLLAMPAFLMHGRAIADILTCLIGLAFLAGCALRGEWGWLRRGWVPVGLAWWGWLVLCSIPGIGIGGWLSLGHALAAVRFLVLVAALEQRVLRPAAARRWLGRVLTASALYIGLSALLQFATGRNLMGWPRGAEGELTGPFQHPRAGAPLSRLLFPALLPPVYRWLGRPPVWRLAAVLLTVTSVGTIVLIGQRMPALLTAFGMIVSGLMLRRLRATVAAALVAGALLLAASAVVSPPVRYRLVTKFSHQMEDFPDSDYGLIFLRAAVIAEQHPLFGRGYAGFRNACPDPRTFVDPWRIEARHQAHGGGAAFCNIHPHNHYLEAVTDAGVPGLLLFCLLMLAWCRGLLRGFGRDPAPLRVALFVAALIQEWPLASTSSFYAIEIAGFFFVMLGWGLAEARVDPACMLPARQSVPSARL